ncbi:uncharacterized protein LOC130673561 isoform X1 [Microplitis mediator]|uniref:uncharacterized protein LOC130673561 isoform X1 n=1 Tax=Microplitis mediator TaxID=375433 RepID=UPI002553F3FC|nr:uncharacterized protein LOC130673561 isoform X1 [Microplitis mediator]
MKRFNGFYGCTFCYAFGKSIGRKHVYPVGNSSEQLRIDDEMRADMMKSFADKNEIKGIKGPSALMLLPLFNLSKGMIVDSMHCCFLGVIKWHTKLLLKKDYKDVIINNKKKKVVVDYYIGRPGQKEEIDSLFLAIMPHNIRSRLPRSINTLATWKASEWRNWLEYCVICLKNILPDKYLDHLALLSEAVNILNSDCITPERLEHSNYLLENYVKLFQRYFGLKNMTYNIHLLTHITATVRDWGPFWSNSTFVFESWNRRIVNKITSPHSPCSQITDRYLLSKYLFSCGEDDSIAKETRNNIRKLMRLPLDGSSHEKIVGRGKATKIKPDKYKKLVFAKSGFYPDYLYCYSRGTVNGVSYNCRRTKETKFCNSLIYCDNIGFGEILKFVCFSIENTTVSGIILQSYEEIINDLSVSYIKKVKCTDNSIFVDDKTIFSPAIKISFKENLYFLKLPNSWETD